MSRPPIDLNLEQIVAEDLDYLTDLVRHEQINNAEIRRSSVVLRRLICDNLLQRVTSSRSHILSVAIPEARELIHNLNSDDEVLFFQPGGYQALGVDVACVIIERGTGAPARPFDPNVSYDARLDTYKKQPVFLIRAVLELAIETRPTVITAGAVTRESVIKYIAHKVGGAHYDARRANKDEELLDIARKAASTTSINGIPTMVMNAEILEDPLLRDRTPLPGIGPMTRDHLDPVLLELLGAARCLVDSLSVVELRAQI